MTATAEEFWERHYRENERLWSGRPNAVLADLAGPRPPGSALDLGCGEGGDAIWLAERGWRVTAVDVSATALDRVAARAAEAGVADRVEVQRHDLATGFPAGAFDLVSAQYLHTPVEFPRARVLRAAAGAVAPGGLLLVVDHGSHSPWSWNRHEDVRFPEAREVLAGFDLDPGDWDEVLVGPQEREATGPDGRHAVVTDTVIALSRRGARTGMAAKPLSGPPVA